MCNNNDKIKQTSDYISFMLQEDVHLAPANMSLTDNVPISIAQCYALYKGRLLGQDAVFALAPDDGTAQTPTQAKRTLTILKNKCGCPAILIARGMAPYNVNRLIAQRVDFIVPQKQMFIPSMLLDLKKVKSVNADLKKEMPPLAQCMLLYHIQVDSLDGKEAKDLEKTFNVSYSTVNRAIRWLRENGLITLKGNKTKEISFFYGNEVLWKSALPMFSSPIEKVVYTDADLESAMESGINALSEYTMINREKSVCRAVSKEELKAAGIKTDNQFGENRIEIWRYSPRYLSNGHTVDKLSLYLSLRDTEDERVQLGLENLINDIKW